MQAALKRLNSRVIYKATMFSGRLFQILTARWIKRLPEGYVPVSMCENSRNSDSLTWGDANKTRRKK